MDELLREVLHRAYELPASLDDRTVLLDSVSEWIAQTANLKTKTYDEMTNEELVAAARRKIEDNYDVPPAISTVVVRPEVPLQAPQKKRSERAYENAKSRKCSVCKEPGHNSRSCGAKRARFAEEENEV